MMDGGPSLVEVVFTLIVFAGLMAVLTNTYAEVVMAATLLAALWQVVGIFGASLGLATILLVLAGLVRLSATLVGTIFGADEVGGQPVATLLDGLLSRRDRHDPDQRDQLLRRQLMDRPPQQERDR